MPPKPEKTVAALSTSETTTAPTRTGDWKNAAQSPRPTAKATNDRRKKTIVASSPTTVHKSSRAPVIASPSAGRLHRLTWVKLLHAVGRLPGLQPVADLVQLAVNRVGVPAKLLRCQFK